MERTYLLGTIMNCIVVGEVRTYSQGHNNLAVSFSVGVAQDVTDIDEETIRDYFMECWDELDAKTKVEATEDCNKTKWEWINERIEESDYRAIYDCSCTDYEIEKNGRTYNFESNYCGQVDIRKAQDYAKMKFTNKNAVLKLLELWDKYHLKTLDENAEKELLEVENNLDDYTFENGEKTYQFILENVEIGE